MTLAYISWTVSTHRHLFGIPIFPHGVLVIVGFLLGSWILVWAARREGVESDALIDALTWAGIGGLVGTRLFWVIGNWHEVGSVREIFMIWHGGMTLLGGIAGGAVAGIVAAERRHLPAVRLVDLAMPGLALGVAVGRVSDLLIGDHLGKATGLPWGFRYVGVDPPGPAPAYGSIVHPVALYDLISVVALFVVLTLFLRRRRSPGSAAALFAAWYAIDRLLLDFLRTDPVRAFGMTGSQLASIGVLLFVAAWLALRARHDSMRADGVMPRHAPLP